MLRDYRDKQSRKCQVQGTCIDGFVNDNSYPSDDERLADMMFLFIAGFETTSSVISFALFELAKNQDLQSQIQQDLQDNNVLPKDATNHTLLNGVVKETMRMYPPAPMGVPRNLGKEFKYGSMTLPKNCTVTMPPYISQRNDEVFENANTFHSSRWIKPTKEILNSYYPFNVGRRNCAGMSLAEIESHIVVLKLLQQFRFTVKTRCDPTL